jgi:predicted Fe-S protein YdhL (DUF1289 family)
MMPPDPASPGLAAPPSPCTKVCTLDAQGFCIGCFRTGTEIGRWMSMSAVEQWRLIAELQARRKQATLASGPDYEVIEDGCR